MYLAVYLMSSLRVCGKIDFHGEFFVSSLKRTHWVCFDHISEHFVKELLTSGLGSLMGTLGG